MSKSVLSEYFISDLITILAEYSIDVKYDYGRKCDLKEYTRVLNIRNIDLYRYFNTRMYNIIPNVFKSNLYVANIRSNIKHKIQIEYLKIRFYTVQGEEWVLIIDKNFSSIKFKRSNLFNESVIKYDVLNKFDCLNVVTLILHNATLISLDEIVFTYLNSMTESIFKSQVYIDSKPIGIHIMAKYNTTVLNSHDLNKQLHSFSLHNKDKVCSSDFT